MNRCAICNYQEGFGSEWTGTPPDGRKVRWRSVYSEFQCDDCASSIHDTLIEQEFQDLENELNNDQSLSGVQTTLPLSEIK